MRLAKVPLSVPNPAGPEFVYEIVPAPAVAFAVPGLLTDEGKTSPVTTSVGLYVLPFNDVQLAGLPLESGRWVAPPSLIVNSAALSVTPSPNSWQLYV